MIITYLLLIILNILILIFFEKISIFINVYDFPNNRKIHKIKTPLLGGLIIVINFFFIFLSLELNILDYTSIDIFFESRINYLIFLISTLAIFLVGFVDDKIDIGPAIKFLFLLIIISLLIYYDNSVLINQLRFSFLDQSINLGQYSFTFTILCFLLFLNACNMFDGINMQSCIYYLIFLGFLFNYDSLNILLIILFISIIFILALNSRGKLFMGDSGVLLSSFVIAYVVIKFYNKNIFIDADTIFILMMVPGIDMFRLFLLRLFNKKNPFYPDKNHIHHLLLNKFKFKITILILSLLIFLPIFFMRLEISSILIILTYLVIYSYIVQKLSIRNEAVNKK